MFAYAIGLAMMVYIDNFMHTLMHIIGINNFFSLSPSPFWIWWILSHESVKFLFDNAFMHNSFITFSLPLWLYCISLPRCFFAIASHFIWNFMVFIHICVYFHRTDNFDKWAYVPWCTRIWAQFYFQSIILWY